MTVCCTGDVLKSLNVHSKKSCASPSRLPNGALVICFGSFVRFIRIGLHLSCPSHGCQGWAFWQSNKSHGRELKLLSGLKLIFHKKKNLRLPESASKEYSSGIYRQPCAIHHKCPSRQNWSPSVLFRIPFVSLRFLELVLLGLLAIKRITWAHMGLN